jgi:hypothetical protein
MLPQKLGGSSILKWQYPNDRWLEKHFGRKIPALISLFLKSRFQTPHREEMTGAKE